MILIDHYKKRIRKKFLISGQRVIKYITVILNVC